MAILAGPGGWVLETRRAAYAIGVSPEGILVHRYWGPRLPRPDDYPPAPPAPAWSSFEGPPHTAAAEYPAQAGIGFAEPALLPCFADGVRGADLRPLGAEMVAGDTPELRVALADAHYPLEITLVYRLYEQGDLIERWAEIVNRGATPITLSRAWSATFHLPPGQGYRLGHLTGRWADETQLRREPLPNGLTVLESRRLHTSHRHLPYFAMDHGADEERGDVWFGALAWSGAWKISVEASEFGAVRLGVGLNDWDFAWELAPGETFSTPPVLVGYTPDGFGAASRLLHDHIRPRLPHGERLHPVLYNSWEATLFDVDEESQARLAEIAAGLGVELFVVDDGWFHGRADDRSGLGDWWPDAGKFPRGLGPLVERVNALGMAFGLWIEPEMVSPQSELYRAHPEWVVHFPSRPRTEGRNQLVLNLGRPDVQDYLIAQIDGLLAAHNIAFIKWDMNRSVSEPGWPDAPRDQREIWVRYVQGLYGVWGELRARHPEVVWQSCAGGGGRADLGVLRFADQIWASDNTIPTSRLEIQHGFTQLFPPITMEAWVTDMGPQQGVGYLPLSFRFHVSMCGALGIGANLLAWGEAERAEAARWVALYKGIRPLVQFGDLFRLRSPLDGPLSAVQYVSRDRREAVLFAFRTHEARPAPHSPLPLRGLNPEALYEVEGVAGARSGAAWMRLGIDLALTDFQSTVRRIRQVTPALSGD